MLEEAAGTRNEVSGGVFLNMVVQGRDITVQLPPAITPALGGLPPASDNFAGRDADVQRLLEALDPRHEEQRAVLVWSVAGLAGVGKTELVLQTSHRALRKAGWFPGGVLFIDMFGYDDDLCVSAGSALDGLLRALGMPAEHIPAGTQDRSRLYRSVLAEYARQGRRLLVVVDNVASPEQARPLLPSDGLTRTLVTSRHTLAGLGARLHDLDVLDPGAAVGLLGQALAQSRGPDDTRVSDKPGAAAKIAALCGYLPLALQIVAALLSDQPDRPLESLAGDLADAHTRLDALQRENVAVRAAFDLSYQRLTGGQARAFRLLSLAAGSDVATETVGALLDQPVVVARRLLGDLARAHLLDVRQGERWRMHDLIRLFADEQGITSAADDQREAASNRILGYYLATAAMASSHLQPPPGPRAGDRFADRKEALAWLDAEHECLVASVEAAHREHRYSLTCQLSDAISPYMRWRQHLQDWLTITRTAVRAARQLADPGGEAKTLSNLAFALRTWFERTGELPAVDEAIAAARAAVAAALPKDPYRAEYLAHLGGALLSRFRWTGDVLSLNEAFSAVRQAVDTTNSWDPHRAEHLSDLSAVLLAQFRTTGDLTDLDEAVAAGRAAVAAAHPDSPGRAGYLSELGAALLARYEQTGDDADLDEAVSCSTRAAEAASEEDHPDLTRYLSDLGAAVQASFKRTGREADLDRAITLYRTAIDATPADHPDRVGYQADLGAALRAKFARTGAQAYLDEAITASKDSVRRTPPTHSSYTRYLADLSTSLQTRFKRTGDQSDLNDAISAIRKAIAGTPHAHSDHSRFLAELGAALLTKYQQSGDQSDTEIDSYIASLGGRFHVLRRAGWTGDPADLDEAVNALRASLVATPPGSPAYAGRMSDLGVALLDKFDQTGDPGYLYESIQASRNAADSAHARYPDRAAFFINLGHVLETQYEYSASAEALNAALACFGEAAAQDAAPAWTRIEAYRSLAALSTRTGKAAEAGLEAVQAAVDLLPQLLPRALARSDREYGLGRLTSLAGQAASAAVVAGRPERAVELLEQTRGILMASTFDARNADLDRLSDRSPGLAREFIELGARLDNLDWVEQEAEPDLPAMRRSASVAWDDLVVRIRDHEGFHDFLRPPGIEWLSAQAADGPIIMPYTSAARCDALIITNDPTRPVQIVPLTNLTEEDAYQQVRQLTSLQHAILDPIKGDKLRAIDDEFHEMLEWLWDTITEPIMTALGYTSTPQPGQPWPRVWWSPVGILTSLPLHAAGRHRTHALTSGTAAVLDRVMSSYTPTIRALGRARNGTRASARSAAIITGSLTPGMDAEARAVRDRIPEATTLTSPAKDAVLSTLVSHDIVHFACMSQVDTADPAASRLILARQDRPDAALTVADISALRLTSSLVYLSTNDTTVTSSNLSNEAIHLTGAFFLAGCQNIISTMSNILDREAAIIAAEFYAYLTCNELDTNLSAHALHHAIHSLREIRLKSPFRWAAYTHTGV